MWLTVKEFAEKYAMSPDQVRRLCGTGRLECIDVGTGKQRSWRVKDESVEALKPTRGKGQVVPLGLTPFLDMYRRK